MGYLVFCDVDSDGKFIDTFSGYNIIPSRQYDYFFFLENELDIMAYKVDMESKRLILK